MKFTWKFDAGQQTLHAPSGWSITVREIAQELQDRLNCRYDLSGPWAGWRIRGKLLKGPSGEILTPDLLTHPEKHASR